MCVCVGGRGSQGRCEVHQSNACQQERTARPVQRSRPEPRRTLWSPPHRSAPRTSTPTRRRRKQASKWYYTTYIHTVCLHRGALFTVDIYSIHIYIYIYIHTHCSTHSSQEEQSRWTGSSPLPVTVRWCGGFRPCVRHKGLLHARRPDSYRPDLPSRFPPTRIPLWIINSYWGFPTVSAFWQS